LSGFVTILIALLVFALMIVVHEFGHFAVAKLFKIHVVEFAVGMGPAIFKKKHRDTTYALRCIPFGGYCMFDDDVGNSDSPNAFEKAAWWKRLCVVLAGAFLNILLGFLVFVILQAATPQTYSPKITKIVPQSGMEASVFQPGDEVLRLNNTDIHIKDDIDLFMHLNGDAPVLVTAKRNGEIIQDTVVPCKAEYVATYYENEMELVTKINGVETERQTLPPPEVQNYTSYIGTTETIETTLLGFEGTQEKATFASVLRDAFYTTIYSVKNVYMSLLMLIRGQVKPTEVSGPVGVVAIIGQATQYGWMSVLSLLGLLTVNLGIMNLLPIPGLDGCKAITTVIEGITKKKLPPKVEGYINMVGFALLILLMLFATFNDVKNLFMN